MSQGFYKCQKYNKEQDKNLAFVELTGFPDGAHVKESACQCRRLQFGSLKRLKRHQFDPWVEKSPWRRKWQPTPVFLPGEYHEQRSLVGYSP